jgi:hypothetical protein
MLFTKLNGTRLSDVVGNGPIYERRRLMGNDLSPSWIKQALQEEKEKLNKLNKAYDNLTNQETSYACGILKMIGYREKILQIWSAAAYNAERAASRQTLPASGIKN